MAVDKTRVTAEDLLRLINVNIRATDSALDQGIDAYNKWVAWYAQHGSDAATAAAALVAAGETWVTTDHIIRWASCFAGFKHLIDVANGLAVGSYTAKDCYYDWNQIFN